MEPDYVKMIGIDDTLQQNGGASTSNPIVWQFYNGTSNGGIYINQKPLTQHFANWRVIFTSLTREWEPFCRDHTIPIRMLAVNNGAEASFFCGMVKTFPFYLSMAKCTISTPQIPNNMPDIYNSSVWIMLVSSNFQQYAQIGLICEGGQPPKEMDLFVQYYEYDSTMPLNFPFSMRDERWNITGGSPFGQNLPSNIKIDPTKLNDNHTYSICIDVNRHLEFKVDNTTLFVSKNIAGWNPVEIQTLGEVSPYLLFNGLLGTQVETNKIFLIFIFIMDKSY